MQSPHFYTVLRLGQPDHLLRAIQQAVIVRGRQPALILCHPDEQPNLQRILDAETQARRSAGRPVALPALAVPEHNTVPPGTLLLA